MQKPNDVLALSCPDKPGLAPAVSGFMVAYGSNIIDIAPFCERSIDTFFRPMSAA